jgi:PKD repeat protein
MKIKKTTINILSIILLSTICVSFAFYKKSNTSINLDFNYSSELCAGSEITFTPTLNDSNVSYYWIFENKMNGSKSTRQANYIFAEPGTYKVTLFVEDPRVLPDTLTGVAEKTLIITNCN